MTTTASPRIPKHRYSVRITYKLLHNSPGTVIGSATVLVDPEKPDRPGFRVSLDEHAVAEVLKGFEATLREWAQKDALSAVASFRKDSRYPIIWNEDTALECTVKSETF